MAPRIAENGEKFNFGIRPKNIAPVRTIVQHMISLDEKPKKGKKAVLFKAPPKGMRYIVKWDSYDTPLSPEGDMLDARIRDISMQSDIFPLDRYWHQQTETSLSEAWNILDYDFDMSNTTAVISYWYIQATLQKNLRNYRNTVKTRYFKNNNENMRLNTMLSLLPPHINSNQFRNLYAEWNTEKGKEIAETNTANRNLKENNHKSGSRSFKRIRQDLRKNGIEPTRTATMVQAFGKSDPKIQRLLEESNSIESRNLSAILPKSEVEQMNFDRVLGKNKKKRKLGIGEGAFIKSSPSSGRFIRQHAMKIEKREPVGVFMPKEQHDMMMRHMMEMENELKNLKENRELPNRRSRF
ncbi:hypothetical protein ZOSMA_5G00640 [Zostera marina]|uniref:Uncharacterized protein n=1 Tax=Zostera marina TaxID=29655 RepID=A0A0K9NTU4_ZOSMR|nr:hypothetical protein ZOSMA_5G00640 [Zostera marina]